MALCPTAEVFRSSVLRFYHQACSFLEHLGDPFSFGTVRRERSHTAIDGDVRCCFWPKCLL